MHNQPCYNKEGNMIGWLSRSIAVTNVVFSLDENDILYILASKRGTGTPDPEFVGKWNLVCGYLDFDETCKEAAIRETFEETGIKVDINNIVLWSLKDDPASDKRQNVGIRFMSLVEEELPETSIEHCEPNEVEEAKWIPVKDVKNYEWAFNHDEIIKEASVEIYNTLL